MRFETSSQRTIPAGPRSGFALGRSSRFYGWSRDRLEVIVTENGVHCSFALRREVDYGRLEYRMPQPSVLSSLPVPDDVTRGDEFRNVGICGVERDSLVVPDPDGQIPEELGRYQVPVVP